MTFCVFHADNFICECIFFDQFYALNVDYININKIAALLLLSDKSIMEIDFGKSKKKKNLFKNNSHQLILTSLLSDIILYNH